MVTQIGLIDYDVLLNKYYEFPNYDLGVTYAYLKDNINFNVRLISSFSPTNLSQYDKIYIFKHSKYSTHPSGMIKDYYKLPVEEFGPGFIDKPLRPNQIETRYIRPNFKCYNNMIKYSIDHPASKISWRISKKAVKGYYEPIRLFEALNGENLRKDIPADKYIALYDEPLDLLNNKEKFEYIKSLVLEGRRFLLTYPVDIAKISDTNILEEVLSKKQYAFFRRKLMASDIRGNVEYVASKIIQGTLKKQNVILLELSQIEKPNELLKILLTIILYYNKTKGKLSIRPKYDIRKIRTDSLCAFVYNYLTTNHFKISLYDYLFNISYIYSGVPKYLIRTDEDLYCYIFDKYGPTDLLLEVEEWIMENKTYEECFIVGGKSDYKRIREKYNSNRYAFNINDKEE